MRILFILAIAIGNMIDNSLVLGSERGVVKEYGIAIILEKKCCKLAQN